MPKSSPSDPKNFVPANSYLFKDPELANFQHLLETKLGTGPFTWLIEHRIIAALKSRSDCLILMKRADPDAFLVVPVKNPSQSSFPSRISMSLGDLTITATPPDAFLFTTNTSEPLASVARVIPTKLPRSR